MSLIASQNCRVRASIVSPRDANSSIGRSTTVMQAITHILTNILSAHTSSTSSNTRNRRSLMNSETSKTGFAKSPADDFRDVSVPAMPGGTDTQSGPQPTKGESGTDGSRGRSASPDRMHLLEKIPRSRRIRLEFHCVSAFVPATMTEGGAIGQMKRLGAVLYRGVQRIQGTTPAPIKKQILFDASGSVQPGEVLAVMGPSGSGKTALLSVLGARTPKVMEGKGEVLFNGQKLVKAQKRRIGFVMQEDLLYESLTVYETLNYAALLRLPKKMSRAEKKERVEAVIAALGLTKCRDTLIGGVERRGVSGGEKKRVSVGHELLINPSVLLLDEPTSGLDSTTALHLTKILRQLAGGGRAVMATIHQPSSRLYQQLDSLLLLSEGYTMYYGGAKLVVDWFGSLDYPCPFGTNMADFILDLANGDIDVKGKEKTGEQVREDMVTAYGSFLQRRPGGLFSPSDLETIKEEINELHCPGLRSLPSNKSSIATNGIEEMGDQDRWGVGFWDQLQLLTGRTIRTRRFDSLSIQKIIQVVGVAVIAVMLWWRKGTENHLLSAFDVAGLLFCELLFIGMSATFEALFTFPKESPMMMKERASGMYRLSAFYLARTLSDLPMDCFLPTLQQIILYWGGGLRPTAGAFLSNWLTVHLDLLVSQSWGLLLGATFGAVKPAQTALVLIVLALILSGGYFVRDMPVWMGWVKYLSFVSWGYNILLKIEFGGRSYEDCGLLNQEERVDHTEGCVPVQDLEDALSFPVDVNESALDDVLVLITMLIVLRTSTYYVLKFKTKA